MAACWAAPRKRPTVTGSPAWPGSARWAPYRAHPGLSGAFPGTKGKRWFCPARAAVGSNRAWRRLVPGSGCRHHADSRREPLHHAHADRSVPPHLRRVGAELDRRSCTALPPRRSGPSSAASRTPSPTLPGPPNHEPKPPTRILPGCRLSRRHRRRPRTGPRATASLILAGPSSDTLLSAGGRSGITDAAGGSQWGRVSRRRAVNTWSRVSQIVCERTAELADAGPVRLVGQAQGGLQAEANIEKLSSAVGQLLAEVDGPAAVAAFAAGSPAAMAVPGPVNRNQGIESVKAQDAADDLGGRYRPRLRAGGDNTLIRTHQGIRASVITRGCCSHIHDQRRGAGLMTASSSSPTGPAFDRSTWSGSPTIA